MYDYMYVSFYSVNTEGIRCRHHGTIALVYSTLAVSLILYVVLFQLELAPAAKQTFKSGIGGSFANILL